MVPPLPPGSVVAGHRLLALVGTGASGSVYLAERPGSSARVALKLLDAELARDERVRRRLLREAASAASLEHPHVVPILEVGERDGTVFLAMHYVEGGDLRGLLAREGPLEPARALDLLGGVAGALDAAHARGLVHRDVKPANILVERTGDADRAYLGDFGLVKQATSTSTLTAEHGFVGTIAYVAPEQIRGDEVEARTDVYALGCVLYECLAGEPPFERDSDVAVLYAHLHEHPPRLTDARPELPEALDGVIRTAMAKAPGDRFATCAAVIGAAREALAGPRRRSRRARPALAALLGVLAVAAVAVVAGIVGGGGDGRGETPVARPRLAVGGDGIALVDPASRRVAGRIALPEVPADVAVAGRSAWAVLAGAERIARIDVRRRAAVGSIRLPFPPGGMALERGALYVTQQGGPGLVRISTATARITARWDIPTRGFQVSDPTGIAVGAGSVWVARGPEVIRVDARTGRVRHRYPLPIAATLLTFADGELWAASSQNGLVEKIDPDGDAITARTTLRGWISALAVADGAAWAAVTPDDLIFRLNQDDASVELTQPAGGDPQSLATVAGGLWVADARARALTRIDTRSGARTHLPLTGSPTVVRAHRGLLWTVAEPPPPPLPGAQPGPTIRVAVPDDGIELDPAFGPFPAASQLLYATCAKLLDYPDSPGAAGARLVPAAAAALPVVSSDGRTYTFRIRPGLRFSPPSGEPLTAMTFKRTIERTLSPRLGPAPAGMSFAGDIAGAAAFHAGRAREVRGLVAEGDTLTITLTRPAGDLPSRLAMPIFCPVPTRTPDPGKVRGLLPSAGPYYARAQTPTAIVLDRNPNYRGARPRRPGRILYLTGMPVARAVALAQRGRVDVVVWDFDTRGPLAPGGPLDRRFGDDAAAARRDGAPRYHVGGAPGVDLLAFNTRRPLFRDARVRRAVNFALDRPALAAVFAETPTNRYVPPAIPAARAESPYPVTGPDLARARRLLPDRRRRFGRLYFCGDPDNLRIARIVRANLRPLGIDLAIVRSFGCVRGPDPAAARSDILLMTRVTPELDPAPFLEATVGETPAFGPGAPPTTWDDVRVRARLARARRLSGAPRLAAYARLEEDLLRGPAPWAPYAAFVFPQFFSERTGCRVIQGAYGYVDVGALCVRRS